MKTIGSSGRGAMRPVARMGVAVCLTTVAMLAAASAIAQTALTHVVRDGDTLFDLSDYYLDDPLLWPQLGEANGLSDPYRIPIGTRLEIPLALLRLKAGGATVVHVSGTVTRARPGSAPEPLAMSERVVDGDIIETAPDGFVTLALADGSHVRITGGSVVEMERMSYKTRSRRANTVLDMHKGRVESNVQRGPRGTPNRFRIESPLMATAVRGTHFGVTVTEAGAVTTDVLEGSVNAAPLQGRNAVRVTAGHGTVATTSARVAPAKRLLAAPDLTEVARLHQRPLLDFSFTPLAGAAGYRVYVARDSEFYEVMANLLLAQPRVRVPDLPDGEYYVAVRGVDASGIEGRSAQRQIELDARPLPPATLAPEHQAQQAEGDVVLRWTTPALADSYEVELARDAAFHEPVFATRAVQTTETRAEGLVSGTYYWRVRTLARLPDGTLDKGPFGDAREFSVRRDVAITPQQDNEQMKLRWEGEPGQRFHLQVASDPGFAQPVTDIETTAREADLGQLPGGSYYLRVQITDSDGYVRPFTEPQAFEVRSFMRVDGGLLKTADGTPVGRGI